MRAQKKIVVWLQQSILSFHSDSRQPAAQDVTLIDKGNLEHDMSNCQLKKRSWSVIPCSRDLPGKTQSSSSKKTARFTRHVGKRDSTGALSWREHIGSIQKGSPNMTKGLTPCQILGKLTSQTKKERYEVCWKEGPEVTSQQ